MMYTFQKNIGNRRAEFIAKDENDSIVCGVRIQPIELYKDFRINFREAIVPCSIDLHVNGNRCSPELIPNGELHEEFFKLICDDFMLLEDFRSFLLNIEDESLYNFYIENAVIQQQKVRTENPDKAWSWLNHEQCLELIAKWNVPFDFTALPSGAESKLLMLYRDSAFEQYQDKSWIKRRTELSNGEYL